MSGTIYRKSALTWLLVAAHMGVPRDVAIMVVSYLQIVREPPTFLKKLKVRGMREVEFWMWHPARFMLYMIVFIATSVYHIKRMVS